MVAYIDDFKNEESLRKLKNFRKFHTKNTDKFFHLKYWIIDNKELAEKLHIDTSEESIGNTYLVRQSSVFNDYKSNTFICDYGFYSEKILTAE